MLQNTLGTFLAKKIKNNYRSSVLEDIKDILDNFDDLSSDELDDICLVLKSLKSSQKQINPLNTYNKLKCILKMTGVHYQSFLQLVHIILRL